jgi:hypothetical protein
VARSAFWFVAIVPLRKTAPVIQFIKLPNEVLLNLSEVAQVIHVKGAPDSERTVLRLKDGSTIATKGRELYTLLEAQAFLIEI